MQLLDWMERIDIGKSKRPLDSPVGLNASVMDSL